MGVEVLRFEFLLFLILWFSFLLIVFVSFLEPILLIVFVSFLVSICHFISALVQLDGWMVGWPAKLYYLLSHF